MEIPEILKGDVHLPLTENTTSTEAIALSNSFYGTHLVESDFHLTQASVSPYGILSLELIDVVTNEVVVKFVNKNQTLLKAAALDEVVNPLAGLAGQPWLAGMIIVANAQEISFLDAMEMGDTYPETGGDNELPRQLAGVLNQYGVLGRWTSGTIGQYCTGGFELLYKGTGADSIQFQHVDSSLIMIINIRTGNNKGLICLRV